MDISTKLQLIKEGYSFGQINESGFTPIRDTVLLENDAYTENFLLDMNHIYEASIEYITEADQGNFKDRVNKIINWLKQKISQFIQFIKSKFSKKSAESEEAIKQTDKAIANAKDLEFSIRVRGYQGTFEHAPFHKISLLGYFVNCHSYSKAIIKKSLGTIVDSQEIKELKKIYGVDIEGHDFDKLTGEELFKGFMGEPNMEFVITKEYYNVLKENLRDNNGQLENIWRKYLVEMNTLLDECRTELKDDNDAEKMHFITSVINHSIKITSACIRIVEVHNNDIINILTQLRSLPKKVNRGK